MMLQTLLLAALTGSPAQPSLQPARGDLVAIRVGRAETVANGPIEHAVILVEDGRIVTIGQDLPIERGIRVLDRPNWVAIPGLVNAQSSLGLDRRSTGGFEPARLVSTVLYPREEAYAEVLEAGVTTLGLCPRGTGVAGQAVAVRPRGETSEEMILRDHVYLSIWLRANSAAKKTFRKGFEDADKYEEKEAKAREKWEKAEEKKKKKKKKSKKDDDEEDGDEKKKDDEDADGPDHYVPPEPDAKVVPFLDLRAGKLNALIGVGSAADYLHLIDALGDEEFGWSLRVPLRNDVNIFEVAERIGERGCRVVLEPRATFQPNTRRDRNLPLELSRAGAKLVLIPRSDSVRGHEQWLHDVGTIVALGLEPDVALRAMTLEPAGLLGLEERIGSLEKDKDANMVFLDGDPFEPTTRVVAVMLEGEFVSGEVRD